MGCMIDSNITKVGCGDTRLTPMGGVIDLLFSFFLRLVSCWWFLGCSEGCLKRRFFFSGR